MSETPTPETDAEAMDGICCYGDPLKSLMYKRSKDGEVVPADFARRLERERDEARRDLVAAEELHRRRFGTLKAEYDAMNVELKQAIDRICQIRLERDNALATLELRVKVWSKEEEA